MSSKFVTVSDLMSVLDDIPSPVVKIDRDTMTPIVIKDLAENMDFTSRDDILRLQQMVYDKMVPEADEVAPGIYIGNVKGATDLQFLKSKHISHIVNAAREGNGIGQISVQPDKLGGIKYVNIAMNDPIDLDNKDDMNKLIQAGDLINQFRNEENGHVLVNCYGGNSRSVCSVLSYLIRHCNLDAMKALAKVKAGRDVYPTLENLAAVAMISNRKYVPGCQSDDEARPRDIDGMADRKKTVYAIIKEKAKAAEAE